MPKNWVQKEWYINMFVVGYRIWNVRSVFVSGQSGCGDGMKKTSTAQGTCKPEKCPCDSHTCQNSLQHCHTYLYSQRLQLQFGISGPILCCCRGRSWSLVFEDLGIRSWSLWRRKSVGVEQSRLRRAKSDNWYTDMLLPASKARFTNAAIWLAEPPSRFLLKQTDPHF